jgi:hypothetical protein
LKAGILDAGKALNGNGLRDITVKEPDSGLCLLTCGVVTDYDLEIILANLEDNFLKS